METGLIRLTALFDEGKEAYLGDHEGKPVVVWMNKLNSFDTEEALRDASVRRAERMGELGEDSPELRGARAEVAMWTDEQLRQAIVSSQEGDVTSEAFDNLQTEEGWSELEDYVARAPALLADEEVKPGDPRFKTLNEKLAEYTRRLKVETDNVVDQHIKDLAGIERGTLEAKFLEEWRARRTYDEWAGTRRTTELYLSARKCEAVLAGGGVSLAGEMTWDHSACDHSERLLSDRSSVRKLPDGALRIMVETYESLRIPPRVVGNSDAPASSSGSSELSSAPEDQSSPSFQGEMPAAAPTT
jgi:hypothetical protein